MRKSVAFVACIVGLSALTGCVSEAKYNRLLQENEIQAAKISELDRQLALAQRDLENLRAQLKAGSGDMTGRDQTIALLKKTNDDLQGKIDALRKQIADLLAKGERIDIPKDVLDALRRLAANDKRFTFDEASGACKFNADILFDTGEDTVKADAKDLLKKFAEIFTGVGKDLNLRIEGHTDDVKVQKPATLVKHPTNWHLSVHRAIAVLRVLYQDGSIEENRMCAAGYGKWRPLVPNTSAETRQKNRRVEIFVVPRPGSVVEPTPVGTPEPTE